MQELIVQLRDGRTFTTEAPTGMTIREAAKHVAAEGVFLDPKYGVEVVPDFKGDWNYYPPSQISLVRFRG